MTFPQAVRFFIDQTTQFISPVNVAAEWVLVVLAAIGVALSMRSGHLLPRLRDAFRRFARRKSAAIVICGVLPVALRLSMLWFAPAPDPSIHDEFSNLLLADTLAQGRLTNPTHPMWMHFESIHIIQRPTYNSMYPPAQASLLALGQILFREPWAGVVIGVGLMCAAICWMMQGWLPPAWALFGTLIAILKIGVVGLWMNTYISASAPAIGGALLLGALPRLRRKFRTGHFAVFALGLVILMNSRPFEGAILGSVAAVYLVPALLRQFTKSSLASIRLVAPAATVLACGVVFTGYYNYRVTGNPLRLPYQVNRDTYGWPENLAFLAPKKLELRHKLLQNMYIKEVHNRDAYKTLSGAIDSIKKRVFENWTFFIGPVLTVPLLFFPWIFRSRRTRPLVIFVAVAAFVNLFQLVLYPYHLAPLVAAIFLIVAQGMRYFYSWLSRLDSQRALRFAFVVPICLILVGAMKQNAVRLWLPMAYWEHAFEPHRDARVYIQNWLTARPGKQLVIVRYAKHHSVDQEWVYNRANIDESKVVWAREMDPVSDTRLVRYFSDREAWLLEADVYPIRVVRWRERTPYTPAVRETASR